MNFTTSDILHELRNPDNFVEVEWTANHSIPSEEGQKIIQEAEEYRKQATEEEIDELMDVIESAGPDTALQAASLFLDLSCDHGVYNTLSITLNRTQP